jgi:hypothetical protein
MPVKRDSNLSKEQTLDKLASCGPFRWKHSQANDPDARQSQGEPPPATVDKMKTNLVA